MSKVSSLGPVQKGLVSVGKMNAPAFLSTGQQVSTIPVRISYRIIELFSEGLYASPHKAIEELVSNAFDAGATSVHVILAPDRTTPDAAIAVIDDGEGMDAEGLRQHWLIGVSNKRNLQSLPKNRKQIGRFGIGKLATYVLARYLTHICKRGQKYYATTMDYSEIPKSEDGGIHTEKKVELGLRELTEKQARSALALFLTGTKPGYKAIQLFGPTAAKSWTVTIMSGLKPMAQEHFQKGRLAWVLRTAMPLRDDFNIFLDGEVLTSSKVNIKILKQWVLGKDLIELPKPAPKELEATEDSNAPPAHQFGLTHPSLGRITGYAEAYGDFLTGGKSEEWGRSNGFFVYVRGRLINIEDDLFGMPALRHGTFACFRMVVHIDKLDDELRSSREKVREGPLVTTARDILHAVFNHVRTWLEENEAAQEPGMRATGRIAQTPGSLTRRPIIALASATFDKKADPKYTIIPRDLSEQQKADFLKSLRERAETDQGLVLEAKMEDLAQDQGVAVFDVQLGTLRINTLHPFIAAHRQDYDRGKDTLILLAMAEVLAEAHLYELSLPSSTVREVMSRVDETLRHFARSSAKRNANMVAQALEDSACDKNNLQDELVAAFQSLGFHAVLIGGSKKADGKAEAHLGASDGKARRHSVSLEAKSKEEIGKKVTARAVDVAAVIQHRDELNCEHAVVVAPDFPTSTGGDANLIKQAKANKENTKRTITYIRIHDLARLIRIVPLKCVGLDRLRSLFEDCIHPDETGRWIDNLTAEEPTKPPFREILDTIWDLQQKRYFEPVEFSAVATALQLGDKKLTLPKEKVKTFCTAMHTMTTYVVMRDEFVELTQRPENIMEALSAALQSFPEDEQEVSVFKV